jgi:hypothetical protein
MGMKWDSTVHEDILVAINDTINLTRKDWDAVMKTLQDRGYTFTESALK